MCRDHLWQRCFFFVHRDEIIPGCFILGTAQQISGSRDLYFISSRDHLFSAEIISVLHISSLCRDEMISG
jgi:hypothetical protein